MKITFIAEPLTPPKKTMIVHAESRSDGYQMLPLDWRNSYGAHITKVIERKCNCKKCKKLAASQGAKEQTE